jgi:diguanylate cyclase (GGDEF)-like protein
MTQGGTPDFSATFTDIVAGQNAGEWLTGRRELFQYVDQVADDCAQRQELFTVLFVRLAGVREVNELIGYDAGEQIFLHGAARLAQSLPDGDIIGKISDDELLVISRDCNSPSCAIKGSQSAIEILQRPLRIDGQSCGLKPAVGIALYPADGMTAAELVRHAAVACTRASQDEAPFFAFFTKALGISAQAEFALQQDIRRAISKREFTLYYQAKVAVQTHTVCGAEALLRWPQQDGSVRMPADFIPIAERGSLMLPLGHWVLRDTCRQIKQWRDAGLMHAGASVNASPQQFRSPDWTRWVAETLTEFEVPPSALTIEITESCAMGDTELTISRVRALKQLGVKISLDDFGTGYSSLAYLTRFALDEVKIDRFFVQAMDTQPGNAKICASMIKLAHELGMTVTAEGVETHGQTALLEDLGCDMLQGFLFSHPMPAAAYGTILSQPALVKA